MKHMLDYLVARPEKGLLAYEMGLPTIVQYWRSFEHLEAFAKDKDDPHLEVWRRTGVAWARAAAPGSGTRRTWSRRGSTRRSTGTCRRTGLGKAGRLVPVSEPRRARASGSRSRPASDSGGHEEAGLTTGTAGA